MNPFVFKSVAERYAEARPYYHPVVMEKVRERLGRTEPFGRALDVGCGTGQSCLALKPLAQNIVGIDPSMEMLAEAPHDPAIDYQQASGERIPFAPETFDLVTASSAFHWFERAEFLAEAHRVLLPSRWLIVYNNAFKGIMRENADFEDWARNTYPSRYPPPPRHREPLTEAEAGTVGFVFRYQETYTNEVQFTAESLTRYLTTHSNVIATVEQGRESLDSVYDWLLNSVRPYFAGSRGTFLFGGPIWYLQKAVT